MILRLGLFISLLALLNQQAFGQLGRDDLQLIIRKIVTDKELNTILYSYDHFGDPVQIHDHFGDHILFMAYNDAVKNAMDTARYNGLENWKHHILMDFSGNRVFLADYGYLHGMLIKYYVQLDEIIIAKKKAKVKLRTNTMDQKVDKLFYFVGEIDFEKKQNDWRITRKQLKEKEPK